MRRSSLKQSSSSRRQQYKRNSIKCVLKVYSKQDVTWWLDRVEIVRKGLRGTKRRWRTSDDLTTEGPWLKWRREYLSWVDVLIKLWRVMLIFRIKSLLSYLERRIWMKKRSLDQIDGEIQSHSSRQWRCSMPIKVEKVTIYEERQAQVVLIVNL